jgi:hypothetical protein
VLDAELASSAHHILPFVSPTKHNRVENLHQLPLKHSSL